GFEVVVGAGPSEAVWSLLQEAGGVPCGLGARDALRIEAGYPLYGHEIDDTTTPVDAALMWAVKLDKGDFTGREIIAETKRNGAGRKLVGLTLQEKIAPRQGYNLFVEGAGDAPVGVVTSGVFSPTTGHSIGMAYVNDPYHKSGTQVQLAVRDNRLQATIVPKKDLLK